MSDEVKQIVHQTKGTPLDGCQLRAGGRDWRQRHVAYLGYAS